MIRIVLILTILISSSWGQAQRYFIRLGSFKHLTALEKSINRLPTDLRSHVIIVQSNGWYVPFAYNTPRRSSLERKLPEFKHYFPDAHVDGTARILRASVVHDYTGRLSRVQQVPVETTVEESYVLPAQSSIHYQESTLPQEEYTSVSYSPPAVNIASPVEVTEQIEIPSPTLSQHVEVDDGKSFNKKMLSGKHFFLAYKSTENSPTLLVKVKFENHRVKYQPIIGDMQLTDANYIVDNHRLYMFANSFSENGAYSKLEEKKDKYLLVSSWSNGKKLNTLRYYYHLNDAKSYLDIDQSNDPLSSVLTEGDEFDALDIEDENY